ncbi:MAG: heme o synthase [Hyphomicrobiaceae bacterium]|nr:heme o synthase [Hyphomicrobiaceae bacterium]
MTDTSLEIAGSDFEGTAPSGTVGDFIALMKPRVMSLVLFTGLVGLVVAPGSMHPVLAIATLICIGVGAGASGALNMWYDADIDAIMQRTASRPVPRGRVAREEALTFGTVLAVGSILSMGLLVNWLAAFLLAVTIGFYLFIYTMWLKRRTPQNIVIGGASGALPPMIGWAAATGSLSLEPFILFLIIFMWTPPHFWALALYREGDYSRAGVPMLPVVAGGDATRLQILIYSLILAPLGVLPVAVGLGGLVYAVTAGVLGGLFVLLAWRVYSCREGRAAERAARQLFGFSILYLLLLFTALLVEQNSGTTVNVWALV